LNSQLIAIAEIDALACEHYRRAKKILTTAIMFACYALAEVRAGGEEQGESK
jgi:hypothetical protein